MLSFNSNLTSIKGIGEKKAENYAKINICTVKDLLYYFPRTYVVFGQPVSTKNDAELNGYLELLSTAGSGVFVQEPVFSFSCRLLQKPTLFTAGRGMEIVNASFAMEDGTPVHAKWFHMGFLTKSLSVGESYVLRGKIHINAQKKISLEQPAIYRPSEYEKLMQGPQPVYPASILASIKSDSIRKLLYTCLIENAKELDIEDDMPQDILLKYGLCSKKEALTRIHFPKDMQDLAIGRDRIVFDEFYHFLVNVRTMKENQKKIENHFRTENTEMATKVISNLPFELTNGQIEAVRDIFEDMHSESVMTRMVQGDVGSGKTIVAFLAMLAVCSNHFQAALMAPTEVLATQHYEALCKLIYENDLPVKPVLLTGSLKASEKKMICRSIAQGEADLIIGTHALFQEKVEYKNLALVITDEQHRFGVRQREELSGKGIFPPHVLVMSATPIPRSLAIILYADMDVSIIAERPKERKKIRTCVVSQKKRVTSYGFIEKEVNAGHQAYIICPMIEENETEQSNVTEYTSRLQEYWKNTAIRVAMLHGKMKPAEKNEIMNDFAEHRIDVLVSTTVVEVGIDVPNATVIMIEDANRFGLASLHQLRGRVGRSELPSYCILVDGKNSASSDEINPRLDIMLQSDNGFEIAASDLKLRGPGDLFGVRQSGEMSFAMADIYADHEILKNASEAAGVENGCIK